MVDDDWKGTKIELIPDEWWLLFEHYVKHWYFQQ